MVREHYIKEIEGHLEKISELADIANITDEEVMEIYRTLRVMK